MTRLPADYLADAEKRARRYMGQWTGTAGSLAADVIRLLHERTAILTELSNMTQQLEDANAQIRRAIEVRREAVAAGKPHDEWYEGLEAGC
jgi:serine phosphatase RsbU (regulator of sigma subunit)